MLKNSSRMKILLSLAMTIICLPNICIAAEMTDICSTITGNWDGDWKSLARRVNCSWKVDAKALKLGPKIMLEVSLKNGRPLFFCKKQEIFTLVGQCKDGKITFDMDFARGSYLNGKLNENSIDLNGEHVTVKLNKKLA